MLRFAFLMLLSADLSAAAASVDFDTAAQVYQAAQVRVQVRASLVSMPEKMRQMFSADAAGRLTTEQLDAVVAGASRGFRIDVFEPPAIAAFAANLDPSAARKTLEFLAGDLGRRMVAADVALAANDSATVDKIMAGGLAAPSTPQRDALIAKLEEDAHSTEGALQVYLRMGRSIAIGTAIGEGADPIAADERAQKAVDTEAREKLAAGLRTSLRHYMAYGYRDLSDADLKGLQSFLESKAGKAYVHAYTQAMDAGFDAMSRRCGERIGEAWRELSANAARNRSNDGR
jgi:hypothetical protein